MAKKTDSTTKPAAPAKPAPQSAVPAQAALQPATPTKPAPQPAAPAKPTLRTAAPAKPALQPVAPAKPALQPAAKTKPAGKSTKAPPAKRKKATKATVRTKPSYTRDDVALRAYFLSEKRRAHGFHGDEHQDWLEAERQLAAESRRRKTAKKG